MYNEAQTRSTSEILFVFNCKPKNQTTVQRIDFEAWASSKLLSNMYVHKDTQANFCYANAHARPVSACHLNILSLCIICCVLYRDVYVTMRITSSSSSSSQLQIHSFTSFVIAKWLEKPYQSVPMMRKTSLQWPIYCQQILLKIVLQKLFTRSDPIRSDPIRFRFHTQFFLSLFRSISESRSKCIPESNGNMHVATASRTSECTSLVIVWWHNSNERSSNTTGSNKRFTNGTTATITNCNASFEFQSSKTLYTGHISRRWSHRRNTSNGKARKYGMTIGNAQSRWYRSVKKNCI